MHTVQFRALFHPPLDRNQYLHPFLHSLTLGASSRFIQCKRSQRTTTAAFYAAAARCSLSSTSTPFLNQINQHFNFCFSPERSQGSAAAGHKGIPFSYFCHFYPLQGGASSRKGWIILNLKLRGNSFFQHCLSRHLIYQRIRGELTGNDRGTLLGSF